MAVYHVRPGITPGTGTGTVGDPWNVNDVVLIGNPKTLAAGDAVFFQTNGTDSYNVTTNLNDPVAQFLGIAVDYSGQPTTDIAVLDGTNVGGNELFKVDGANGSVINLGFSNGPSHGLWITGDSVNVLGCIIQDNGGEGVRLATGAEGATVHLSKIIGNASIGYYNENNTRGGSLTSSYIENNSSAAILSEVYTRSASILGNIIVMGGVAEFGIDAGPSFATLNPLVKNNTIYMPTPRNDSQNVFGIGSDIGTAKQGCIIDNIVVGVQNLASGVAVGYGCDDANGFNVFLGNLAFDCDNAVDANVPNSKLYEAPDTTDPAFINAAGGDFTPGVNLLSVAKIVNIYNEVSWIDPGALSHLIASIGGLALFSGIVGASFKGLVSG